MPFLFPETFGAAGGDDTEMKSCRLSSKQELASEMAHIKQEWGKKCHPQFCPTHWLHSCPPQMTRNFSNVTTKSKA